MVPHGQAAVSHNYAVDDTGGFTQTAEAGQRLCLTRCRSGVVVGKDMQEFELRLGDLTDDEREIIAKGCLINYYRG